MGRTVYRESTMERNQGSWCTAIEDFTLANPLQICLFLAHGNKVGLADSSNKSTKAKQSPSDGT